jgi:D-beta-D-heptose 7-phosphate kinase/D-beta-D-heptose 1-phosphate adenosyltransferase
MSKKILVVGDSCLDEFVYCEANRLAPDLPVPVLNEVEVTRNPGMAMNVHRNIRNYISEVDIVTNQNWNQYTKRRYVHLKSNHHFFRVDSSVEIPQIDLKSFDFDYEMIVISDYNKGFLSYDDISFICQNHPLVFLDSKKDLA